MHAGLAAASLGACLFGLLGVELARGIPPASDASSTDSSSQTPATPVSSPRVLIVGDSTTVHMRSSFEAALAARRLDATIDARSFRTVAEGRRVLQTYDVREFDLVVVLLGANGRRSASLRNMQALRVAGVDTVATVQAPRQRVVNRAVRAVFGRHRISWAGHAARLGIRTTDGKHYSPAGYRERARYLAGEIAERVR